MAEETRLVRVEERLRIKIGRKRDRERKRVTRGCYYACDRRLRRIDAGIAISGDAARDRFSAASCAQDVTQFDSHDRVHSFFFRCLFFETRPRTASLRATDAPIMRLRYAWSTYVIDNVRFSCEISLVIDEYILNSHACVVFYTRVSRVYVARARVMCVCVCVCKCMLVKICVCARMCTMRKSSSRNDTC